MSCCWICNYTSDVLVFYGDVGMFVFEMLLVTNKQVFSKQIFRSQEIHMFSGKSSKVNVRKAITPLCFLWKTCILKQSLQMPETLISLLKF